MKQKTVVSNFFFKNSFVIVFMFFNFLWGIAQNENSLTKQEIDEDLNFLIDTIIKQVYTKQIVFDKLTNRSLINSLEQIKNRKKEIPKEEQFLEHIRQFLNLTNDAHSQIVSGEGIDYLIKYLPNNEKSGLLKYVDTTMLHLSKKRYEQYTSYLHKNSINFSFFTYLNYINGEYYNLVPIKRERNIIEKGAKIVKIDDEDIHNWVNQHICDFQFKSYDVKNRRYYIDFFYGASSYYKNIDNISITFENPSGEIIKEIFKLSERVEFIKENWLQINLAKVKFFKKDKTLYIRLDEMVSSEEYIEKIHKYGARKDIDRIIIDIRENFGGNDIVWKEIIEELIDKPIRIDLDVVVKESLVVKNYYGEEAFKQRKQFENLSLLEVDSKELENFRPSKTSIRFPKKIIILQDNKIFSSAASFAAIGGYSDNFITVGGAVDKPIGVGVTPMYFMLPNSKVLIRIDNTVDFTNAVKVEGAFKEVQIEVEETVESKHIWVTKNGNRWKRSFLFKHDPYYQKALEVKID